MTPKEKEYVMEYLNNGYNALQAYNKVYNKPKGYKSGTPYDILNKPDIKAFVREYREKKLQALDITNERIMEKLEEIAFSAEGDKYYKPADKLKALDMLKEMLGDSKEQNVIKVIVNDNSGIE